MPPLFEVVPHWTSRQAIATLELPTSLLVVAGWSRRFGDRSRPCAALRCTQVDRRRLPPGRSLGSGGARNIGAGHQDLLERERIEVLVGAQIDSDRTSAGDHGATVQLRRRRCRDRQLACSSPPGGAATLAALGVAALSGWPRRLGAIPGRRAACRVTPGVWAVGDLSRGRARSPTSPCTRRGSVWPTDLWATSSTRPTIAPCPGSPSLTTGDRIGRAHRSPGRACRRGPCRGLGRADQFEQPAAGSIGARDS